MCAYATYFVDDFYFFPGKVTDGQVNHIVSKKLRYSNMESGTNLLKGGNGRLIVLLE